MKIKHGLTLLFIAALSIAAVWLWRTETIRPAPAAAFKTIDNEDISLGALKGKPVIVTFWATDCPGCIEEIPHLIELYRQYHRRGLEIIAVSMYYDPPSHVVNMRTAKQLPYDVVLDLRAEHSQAFGNVMLTPTTFLISPEGNIVMQKIGVFDLQDMKARIEALLNLAKPAPTTSTAANGGHPET
ncbi:TlpA disulfide reductase family protein [Methylomarinum sp. Ch1-1]|uniref:TlpA disulfide reductase family protein n=1 Tax=Methylomarinum roseum TaxID=3067653 RepID=A0AAU7NVA0_9GAMM|nr:TlpA disulfide reductase family protein [Methylomarinum sp. Ch1-1]MDP4519397.1 TlpA disulfide reductase family protein [Methylomarinum sp. Ch1-1]